MWEVILINNRTGRRFTLHFDNPFLMNRCLNKVKYSKAVTFSSKWNLG